MSCTSATKIQKAMALLIDAFNQYSAKEGDKYTLSKRELKELLNNEFKGPIEESSNTDEIGKIFNSLDANGDGEVDFQEYMTLVCVITMITNNFFKEMQKKK